jgi:hypothetical protein
MKFLLICAIALVGLSGCGEDVDELGPYVEKMKALSSIDAKLAKFQDLLKAENLSDEAKNVRSAFTEIKQLVDSIPIPEDKSLKALHNSLVRTVDEGLTKLKDPDSITFVVNARKRSHILHEAIVKMVNNLKREWENEKRPGPFPISIDERLDN